MNNYGCIYISGMKSNNSKYAEITKAKFISNSCDSGCALTINTQSIFLSKSKISSNIAQRNGGGINEISDQYDIFQENVIFLDNEAKFGGAMYIKSKILNISQLNQVYYSNNKNVQIYDQPTILVLKYFDITIPSLQVFENILEISQPNYLKLSKILDQSQQYFLVPSNQQFDEYNVFNQTTRQRQKLDISLNFQAQNQFYEEITNLNGSICSVQQRDFDINLNQPQQSFINYSLLNFDMITLSYRLDQLLFSIDPYNPQNIVKQVQLECSSIYNTNYRYLLNLRSFFCQIGEYYVDDGCLLCKSEKGLYSVKANQTKCQQVDFQKVKNDTETDIELPPGQAIIRFRIN